MRNIFERDFLFVNRKSLLSANGTINGVCLSYAFRYPNSVFPILPVSFTAYKGLFIARV